MKITLAGIILMCFCSLASMAQTTYSIKGAVTDTASKTRLINASIVVLNAKDSTLRTFTRAGTNGAFSIPGLSKGNFILLVTYPDFADYAENFTLDSVKRTHDFGVITMSLKSRLLADVIIKGEKAAIKIKGDTTEFNASSYKLQPNAKVEDLLKQLPGITVDKDGKITAQGQTVNKVLVDGEEFFGDDPTLVTKNIRQDMVDKVQLYDKKSDQATFTGIDDGEKTKTINIKLKEDKKSGYFGKVDAGAGTDDYYQAQVLFNKFKAKQKFSAYGTVSNTGKTGLGWEDANKYGGGSSNMEFTDDGGIMIFGGGGDDLDSFDGRYSGEGIPKAQTGGLHYDTKWNTDKESLNTNYKVGYLGVKGTKNIQSQYNFATDPAGNTNTVTDQRFDNSMFRQKLDAIYQLKIDSTSNIKLTVDGTLKNGKTSTGSLSNSYRPDSTKLNFQDRSLTNDADDQIFNASAFYTKKLKKPGRTLSVNLKQSINISKADGQLYSDVEIYNTSGMMTKQQLTDQKKVNDIRASVFNSNITYTEPLSKSFSVVLNYGLGLNNSSADRRSFAKTPTGYNALVDSVSSDYALDQLSNQGGAIFNYKKGNSIINFGTRVASVNFKQDDEMHPGDPNRNRKRDFVNWSPQASYQYKFNQQSSFRLGYNGYTTQPTIDQIQPVIINTDPLNNILGNPDLKPSFRNSINASYNSYKVLSGQSIWISAYYSMINNAIVNSNLYDRNEGKSTIQYFNLNDKTPTSLSLYANYNKKIKAFDMNVGLNGSINNNTSYNYTNSLVDQTTVLNQTKSNTYSIALSLSKFKQKKYEFWASGGPSYTVNESSVQQNVNNNSRGFRANGNLNIYLPGKVQIGSDVSYQYQAASASFNEDFSRTLLNANISKAFFKQENVKIVLSGNDLLNQNNGFSRSAYASQITQTTYTTIRRYFLLSVVWDFNKMGGVSTPAK